MRWTVVIPTRDRAKLLAETLESLLLLADPGVPYEVIVVDNGSRDGTRSVVEAAAARGRVPMHYLIEPRGGVSAARNTGIKAAQGEWIAFADDDVRVVPGWLASYAEALERLEVDFAGGPVLPRWGAPRPAWLPAGQTRGEVWGVLGLFDYGVPARPLGKPLSANMAFRRTPLLAVGGFREDLGRDATSLKGQELPELLLRHKAAGGRGGWWVPAAIGHHWVPPDRLTKWYFRRWFYWKGISRAAVGDRVYVEGLDWVPASQARRLLGIPRGVCRESIRSAGRLLLAAAARDRIGTFEAETGLWYAAGYARAAWFGDPSPTGKLKRAAAAEVPGDAPGAVQQAGPRR